MTMINGNYVRRAILEGGRQLVNRKQKRMRKNIINTQKQFISRLDDDDSIWLSFGDGFVVNTPWGDFDSEMIRGALAIRPAIVWGRGEDDEVCQFPEGLPPMLRNERVIRIFNRLVDLGWLDKDYKPYTKERSVDGTHTTRLMMAVMIERINYEVWPVSKEIHWSPFYEYWGVNNLNKDLKNKAQTEKYNKLVEIFDSVLN